ncbi:6059_t:CDS:1, partial [Funneliformis geosporum]
MEFSVRIEPTDINEIQTTLHQQSELKLTGLPFNTTQLDLS